MTKTLELKLTDGTKIVRTFDLERVYDLVGRTKKKWRLTSRFPFFACETEEYITFRYQDTFTTMRASTDSSFSALVSVSEFVSTFGVDFVSYEELKLRSAVAGA